MIGGGLNYPGGVFTQGLGGGTAYAASPPAPAPSPAASPAVATARAAGRSRGRTFVPPRWNEDLVAMAKRADEERWQLLQLIWRLPVSEERTKATEALQQAGRDLGVVRSAMKQPATSRAQRTVLAALRAVLDQLASIRQVLEQVLKQLDQTAATTSMLVRKTRQRWLVIGVVGGLAIGALVVSLIWWQQSRKKKRKEKRREPSRS